MKILIPARLGSKGLPGKNRKLFHYTAKIIPNDFKDLVHVSTDDPAIKHLAGEFGFKVHDRPENISLDETSTKEVVKDFLKSHKENDLTVLLYLTYPERKWDDVQRALEELKSSKRKSLLCSFDCEVSPYLMAFELPNNLGKQVISHDLYRRQDYPKCFEISHFVCVFYDNEIDKLNNNLYNDETYFMKCKKKIDVDLISDLERFNSNADTNNR